MNEYLPVLLLTTERSGSNLLRAILNSHSEISSPPPSGVIDTLAGVTYRYISSLKKPHFTELINDAITLTQTHMNPWDVNISPKELSSRIEDESFWALFRAMNEVYANNKGCSYWFSKEPGLFKHIYELSYHLPRVKYIYMVRDGRDVAASMLKGGLHARNIIQAAQRWSHEQKMCLKAMSDPLIRKRSFFLYYEDLIEMPGKYIQKLMNFIGLEFEKEQLDFHMNEENVRHSRSSKFWANISKPIDPSKRGAYKKKLTKRQIEIFESITWEVMKLFNYKLESSEPIKISRIEQKFINFSSQLLRRSNQFVDNDEKSKRENRIKITAEMNKKNVSLES